MEHDERMLDPHCWLESHGDTLYRYALRRTSRADVAEDLVQETLLAAWRGREAFQGMSGERTWLMGILKHKIDDHFRSEHRQPVEDAPAGAEADGDGVEDAFFDDSGHWRIKPQEWASEPIAMLEAEGFWRVLLECLAKLPERQRESFTLRDIDGLDMEQLCKLLSLSTTNIYVLLHRARLQMRRCLEVHWFGPGNE